MKKLLLILLFLFPVHGAWANDDDFVEFFSGACYWTIHDLSLVRTLAKTQKWKSLPEDFKVLGNPIEKGEYDAWMAKNKNQKILVAINETSQAKTCTNIIEEGNLEKILSILKRNFKLRLISDETEGFQKFLQYVVNSTQGEVYISIVTHSNPSIKTIHLSVSIFK